MAAPTRSEKIQYLAMKRLQRPELRKTLESCLFDGRDTLSVDVNVLGGFSAAMVEVDLEQAKRD